MAPTRCLPGAGSCSAPGRCWRGAGRRSGRCKPLGGLCGGSTAVPGGRQTPGHSPCTCTLQLGTPGSGGAPGRGGDGTLGWGMLGDGGQVRVRVMLRDGSCSVRGCSGMGTFRDGDAQGWGMLRIAVRGCSGMGVPCLGPGARSGHSPVQHHSIRQGADEQVRVEVPIHIHPPRECVPKSPHPHTFPIQHLGTRTAVTLGTVGTPQPPSPPPAPYHSPEPVSPQCPTCCHGRCTPCHHHQMGLPQPSLGGQKQ